MLFGCLKFIGLFINYNATIVENLKKFGRENDLLQEFFLSLVSSPHSMRDLTFNVDRFITFFATDHFSFFSFLISLFYNENLGFANN